MHVRASVTHVPHRQPTTCFLSSVIAGSLPLRWCESNDPGVATGLFALRLPRFLLTLYAWFHRHVLRDPVYASLVEGWRVKDGQELYALVAQREDYRAEWFEYWQREKLDLVLTVPNALPAIRHGDIRRMWKACGYTFLFNIVCVNPPPLLGAFYLIFRGPAARLFRGSYACYARGRHARQAFAYVQATEQD
jgi:hypothetical protein